VPSIRNGAVVGNPGLPQVDIVNVPVLQQQQNPVSVPRFHLLGDITAPSKRNGANAMKAGWTAIANVHAESKSQVMLLLDGYPVFQFLQAQTSDSF